MDRKNLAAIAAAFVLGAGGATVTQRLTPPMPSKVVEPPAGPMDVCLRPPLRVAFHFAQEGHHIFDGGRTIVVWKDNRLGG